jgi:hypothetical protein
MAFSIGREHLNIGNKRAVLVSCSVDSASGNIVTGLKVVDHFTMAPVSMATSAVLLKKNVGSGATSIPGTINLNGAASGDVFLLTVFGR